MKKGNLEIKEDMDDSFVFRANNYSVYRIGNMQDLKDLRSLIDTVLKEERKIGGHTYSKSGKDMCCQPLTEGEKCECKEMSCKDGCDRKHTCKTFWCKKCEPQESNKELVEWAYVSEKYCVVCSTGIDVRTLKLPLCDRHFKESNKEGEPLQKAFTRGNSCLYYQRRIRRSWWIETKRPR